ncbi:MAG: dTDP-4-dehydrorhamnose 3,5-epimerase [Cyclobacteriaceae bacterium]
MNNDVVQIRLNQFEDDRGSFQKKFSSLVFPNYEICQINQVKTPKGVFRGLHYQKGQSAESKIFTVNQGIIQLVYFEFKGKKADSVIIEADNTAILIPRGYATGYLVLSDTAEVLYYSNNDYNPDAESGIRWNDGILSNIHWLASIEQVSDKDKCWPDMA